MRNAFLLLAIGWIILVIPHVSFAEDNVPRITIQELKSKMDNGEKILIIDVRTGEDYASSKVKIKGAVRIPVNALEERQKELPKDREIITYCS
jgi:rhodanese-related sulfurtransferase